MPRKRKVAVPNHENVQPVEKVVEKPKKNDNAEKPAKKQKREPEYMIGDGLSVVKAILSVQKTDCNSSKSLNELQKLYKKMTHSLFMKSFMAALQTFLIRDDGEEYASRVLKFMGVFVASYGEEVTESGASHPIIDTFFKEILGITANLVHVRTRICLLVTNTMSSFSQKAELDEAIIEKITERMLFFMKDVSPLVRMQAVFALQRLQDPENTNEDPVTKAYIFHMESDPAPKVRQATITAIAKKIHNIPAILERLHDVDEKVRRHTYLQMSSYSVKSYKIVDRINILTAGLNDRSDVVKKAVTNLLLSNWIGVYDNDYAEFIRAIKLDSDENELIKFRNLAEMALSEIFKKRKIADLVAYLNLPASKDFKNCLPLEKSTLEMLIVWKMISKCYQDYISGKRNGNDIKDDVGSEDEEESAVANQTISNVDIFPELSVLCDYMEKFVTDFSGEMETKNQKIYFSQCIVALLEIVQLNDLDDEVGKERLKKLLKTLLLTYDISEFAIQEIAHVVEKIIPDVNTRLAFFNQVVTEMIKPGAPSEYSRQTIIDDLIDRSDIDRKVQAKQIKLRMMDLKEQESSFAQQKQYAECQKVSEEYNKLNGELIELLKPVASQTSSESTQSLLENLSSVVTSKKITQSEILKNLRICYFAIVSRGVKVITHEILQIYKEFVRYHLESAYVETRIWALKTATAYSLLYESIAKEIYIIIKSQVFRFTHAVLWECSIQCIFDLLLRYGIEKMDGDSNETNVSMSMTNRSKRGGRTLYTDVEDEEDEPDELNIAKTLDVMQMLLHLLEQSNDVKITKVLIRGFCKLIVHSVYCTRELMSKFLLMYFNPATSAEISQILGIFLENIIKRKKQEYLHNALTPTIVTLVEAPYDSPLRDVKLDTVLKYIVGATRPIFCSNGLNLHNTLGMEFLAVMKDNPDNKEILKIFAKELFELEIGEDPLLKRDMAKQVEVILKESLADARTKKYLTDFCKILSGTYRAPLTFSSLAKAPNSGDENELEEEENEEEAANEEEKSSNDTKEIETEKVPAIDTGGIFSVSSDIQIKSFEVKIEKIDIPADGLIDFTEGESPKAIETPAAAAADDEECSMNDEDIPQSQEPIELPATQEIHVELPATQDFSFGESSVNVSVEDASIISSDVPSTPSTPMTVVKKPALKKQSAKVHMSAIDESGEESIVIPETPEVRSRRSALSNAKRQLNISQSTPATPSQSSPFRKLPRRTAATPKSALASPLATQSPRTPTSRLSTSLNATTSTPNTSRLTTRQQSRVEVAQKMTLTRSASKNLKVKPSTIVSKLTESEKSQKEVKKPEVKKAEVRKVEVKPSRLPVRTSQNPKGTDARPVRATRSQNPSRPPWK